MFYPVNLGFSVNDQQWLTDFFGNFHITGDDRFWEGLYSAHPDNQQRINELLTVLLHKPHKVGVFAGAGISKPYAIPAWGEFLAEAARSMGLEQAISPLLEEWRYPEAAQLLEDHDLESFEAIIRKTFSHHQIVPKLLGAGALLPFLPFDYLVTTNFDNVMEAIYQLAGMTIKPVIYGASPKFAKAAHLEEMLPLLKIHGDYLHERILTQDQYERSYGRDSDLYRHLVELFSTISFLFIGFSLTDIEIGDALREASRMSDIPQFVILSAGSAEIARERDQAYLERGVRPIWYIGDHGQVSKLLGYFVTYNRPELNLTELGICLRAQVALKDTLRDCERLLSERPGCHAYQMAFVNSLFNSANHTPPGNFDEVSALISRIDRALGRAPDFVDAYVVRAFLNYQRFSIGEAYEDLSTAIRLRPDAYSGVHAMRGLLNLQYRQDSREASSDFENAIKATKGRDPELDKAIRLYLLTIALFSGEPDALSDFRHFVATTDLPPELKDIRPHLRIGLFFLGCLDKIGLMAPLIRYYRKRMKKSGRSGTNIAVRLGRAGLLRKKNAR